ncbi:MAG: hypothetical protein HS127_00460 [Planctomycetia bacterium]|nr:hypothetical protein [Planctomycetia bacterium]
METHPPAHFPYTKEAVREYYRKIHKHEKLIATKQKPCFCPKCKSTHVNFTLHECRYRLFHVIIDSLFIR